MKFVKMTKQGNGETVWVNSQHVVTVADKGSARVVRLTTGYYLVVSETVPELLARIKGERNA